MSIPSKICLLDRSPRCPRLYFVRRSVRRISIAPKISKLGFGVRDFFRGMERVERDDKKLPAPRIDQSFTRCESSFIHAGRQISSRDRLLILHDDWRVWKKRRELSCPRRAEGETCKNRFFTKCQFVPIAANELQSVSTLPT